MIKQIVFTLCFAVLSAAAFAHAKTDKPHQESAKTEQLVKQSGQRHQASGVVSVDIQQSHGASHLLLGKVQDGQKSLWYQASHDQGETWSSSVEITAGLDFTAKFHRGNDARLAVQGDNIVAVWTSRVEGTPHNAGPMMSVRSADAGKTWQVATMPADWNGPHGFFAMDGNDSQINLVWLDSREQVGKGSQGLRYSSTTDGGLTWLANKTLDKKTCACCWNTARFDDEGQFYVLYRDKKPSDMALGKVDQQHQWQRLSTVGEFNWDFQGCPHIGGGLAFESKQKRIHATVSTGLESKTGLYYLNSVDQGQHWTSPVPLGDDMAVHSDLAVSTNGNVLAAWDHITENGFEIVYALSFDQGQHWTTEKLISTPKQRASHPRVVAVDNGFLVVWTEDLHNELRLQTKVISDVQ